MYCIHGSTIILADTNNTIDCNGIRDDGSDETIVSPLINYQHVLKGIGLLPTITPVTVKDAMKYGDNAHTFNFRGPRPFPV